MFDKILIANRGEIACRIIRSAKKMGIKTVAVFSEADRGALHVELADEAVCIGPPPAAESYLLIDKIIAACKESGAQAVHPGFGFLSENAGFVKALDEAGIVFIGPPTGAIGAMGDKIESKRLAQESNVSTVPGHMDLIESPDHAADISGQIGYPVMIKASAGGGGKGMRIAWNDQEAREGFTSARNEAKSSFADDRVFIEKFIEEPRHIEIQVLADKHGNTLYLGERECSIQRRHQKVIEEAPSPFIDPDTRRAMGEQAVALARAVDYFSAGTVEFIVDKDKNFYFLEMNTRIQVEHPITEMITGIDIVEWMIRIAAGEELDFSQEDVSLKGWSLEARIYAEDPLRNFMPSIGRLARYVEPPLSRRVRVDSGVVEGSEITMYYDPMIAKLVTHAPSRDGAIAAMNQALDSFYIRGINHNIPFLSAVIGKERFKAGRLTTNFIPEEFPDGFVAAEDDPTVKSRLILLAAVIHQRAVVRGDSPAREGPTNWSVMLDRERHEVEVNPQPEGYLVHNGGRSHELMNAWYPGEPVCRASIDNIPLVVQVDRRGPAYRLSHGGSSLEFLVLEPRVADMAAHMPIKEPPDLSKYLLSPMPGLLVSLAVEEGQRVEAGEALCVVEAMKMENILRADNNATVLKLHAQPGDSLAVDQMILEFE